MAWIHYGDTRRKVGARLRVVDLPRAITGQAPNGEEVWQVVVVSRSKGIATLRVWSTRPGWTRRKPERHTVTIVNTYEDSMWVVEKY